MAKEEVPVIECCFLLLLLEVNVIADDKGCHKLDLFDKVCPWGAHWSHSQEEQMVMERICRQSKPESVLDNSKGPWHDGTNNPKNELIPCLGERDEHIKSHD